MQHRTRVCLHVRVCKAADLLSCPASACMDTEWLSRHLTHLQVALMWWEPHPEVTPKKASGP